MTFSMRIAIKTCAITAEKAIVYKLVHFWGVNHSVCIVESIYTDLIFKHVQEFPRECAKTVQGVIIALCT